MDGLVFTCQFKGVPPDTFAVTEFQLTESLSELFTLSLTAVSALPSIPFDDMLGFACSLTVTRNGKPVRTYSPAQSNKIRTVIERGIILLFALKFGSCH